MDFQEALAKYKNKTASQQEIQFVEQTVNEARKTAKIRLYDDKHITIGQRICRFFTKLVVLTVFVLSLLGYCYYSMSVYGKENINYGKNSAQEMAENYLLNNQNISNSKLTIQSSSKKLILSIPFEKSYYLYRFDIKANTKVYSLTVDSYSGMIEMVEIDY